MRYDLHIDKINGLVEITGIDGSRRLFPVTRVQSLNLVRTPESHILSDEPFLSPYVVLYIQNVNYSFRIYRYDGQRMDMPVFDQIQADFEEVVRESRP